jgi:hypothetical protein
LTASQLRPHVTSDVGDRKAYDQEAQENRSRAQPPPVPPWPQFAPPGFPLGVQFIQVQPPPSEAKKVTKEEINPSSFTLEDGSRIVVRPRVQGVFKMIGQTAPTGEPVYTMQLSWDFEVKTAETAEKIKTKE